MQKTGFHYELSKQELLTVFGEQFSVMTREFNYQLNYSKWGLNPKVTHCTCGGVTLYAPMTADYKSKKSNLLQLQSIIENYGEKPNLTVGEREHLLQLERQKLDWENSAKFYEQVITPHLEGCCSTLFEHWYNTKKINPKTFPKKSLCVSTIWAAREVNNMLVLQRYQSTAVGLKKEHTLHCDVEIVYKDYQVLYARTRIKKGRKYIIEDISNMAEIIDVTNLDSAILIVEPSFPTSKLAEQIGLAAYLDMFSAEMNRTYEPIQYVVSIPAQSSRTPELMDADMLSIQTKQHMKVHYSNLRSKNKRSLEYITLFLINPHIENYVKQGVLGLLDWSKIEFALPLKEALPFNKSVIRQIKEWGWFRAIKDFGHLHQKKFVQNLARLENKGISINIDAFHMLAAESNRVNISLIEELIEVYGYDLTGLLSYFRRTWANQALMIHECIVLLRDMNRMALEMDVPVDKYSQSLKKAHDLLMRDYQFVFDKDAQKGYSKHVPHLNKQYAFDAGDWSILVPNTLEEIYEEGQSLGHCVASYANNVAKGNTVILFLRNKKNLETSVATIEVQDHQMVQFKGRNNAKVVDVDILAFMKRWKSEKSIY